MLATILQKIGSDSYDVASCGTNEECKNSTPELFKHYTTLFGGRLMVTQEFAE